MKIAIKGTKATKEFNISFDSIKLTLGIKVYSVKDLNKIRKEYLQILNTKELSRLEELVEAEPTNVNITALEEASTKKELDLFNFYRKHIVYLKNISLETDNGDLIIPDTREVQPIVGLWTNSDECLVALLDLYFDSTSLVPLITDAVTTVVFNSSYKEEASKN